MVYYIRFLKSPNHDASKAVVKTLVTVATDLGDEFYPGDLSLYAAAVSLRREQDWHPAWQKVEWKIGMRNVWIILRLTKSCAAKDLRLIVSSQPSCVADEILGLRIPEILSVRSDVFPRGGYGDRPQAGVYVERRYKTSSGKERSVYEEMGESIARHIW